MARCLLLEAQLSKELWAYAVMASAYIRNRCYNPRTGKKPYEALTGRKPDLSKMHTFATTCYAYVQSTNKLDARSEKGLFVEYDKGSPAYLVYFPASRVVKRVKFDGLIIIILVLPPGVVCSSNRALPMLGTADGDAVSRCQVLGRAGSVHHGADR